MNNPEKFDPSSDEISKESLVESPVDAKDAVLEKDARAQRYRENLERLKEVDLKTLYPSEVKKRNWSEITDEDILEEERKKHGFSKTDLQRHGLFQDESGQYRYFITRFKKPSEPPKVSIVAQIELDMLATANEVAPWGKQAGYIENRDSEWFGNQSGQWTFWGNFVQYDPKIVENMINGLGDPKYSGDQKREFIYEDISAIVHENVHINNTDSIDFGGPHRKISETAPMAAEYLAFPGKNGKMRVMTDNARRLLKSERVDTSFYNDATLMGMLIMADEEGLLPEEEEVEKIDNGLIAWQVKIESLDEEELKKYRRRVEDGWLLSHDDVKLEAKLLKLKQKYPLLIEKLLEGYNLRG